MSTTKFLASLLCLGSAFAVPFGMINYETALLETDWAQWFKATSGDGSNSHFPEPTSGKWRDESDGIPTQAHLALANASDEMRLLWNAPEGQSFRVRYGSQSGVYSQTVTSTFATYTRDNMCSAPANTRVFWKDPGYIHDAVMTGLQPGQTYYYQYEVAPEVWSNEVSFITPPPVGPDAKVTVAAFGDLGEDTQVFTKHSSLTTNMIKAEVESGQTGLVLHIGDISYSFGRASLWEDFFTQIEPIASKVPYMVGLGNHEELTLDAGGECGYPYRARFEMPSNGMADGADLWYSFDYGPIHFTVISTEHDISPSSQQFEWAAKDLASVDRSRTPWVIFTAHRPMYLSSDGEGDYAVGFKASFEPLLAQYKVDLALWGHVHEYERFCPMMAGECTDEPVDTNHYMDPRAPIHAIIGMAGAGVGPEEQELYMAPGSLFRERRIGYSRVSTDKDAEGRLSLHFEFIRSDTQTVRDEMWIHKSI
eukprot:TRINITY_DN59_c0_g1::TRINITY_DN59_c0_g1_i1::g.14719::m.14719 TRINITY_DN59_c0_g1::TRINITY_DN59_c0_g1_i1::g.14719  ORF type:complete len:495 (+),score=147.38,sp/Q9LMG7/PPA2_ARATH/36.78/5e-76,Metallophos/PF00149.23/1.6e-17,Metallophos_C/PF14008.1/7.6e-08,PhoD/PF09423.5/1.9e-05,Metallophos_2/PF12850.2/0.031 TRINITY_DN59_c0_g1_i1:51-1487(+)